MKRESAGHAAGRVGDAGTRESSHAYGGLVVHDPWFTCAPHTLRQENQHRFTPHDLRM